VTEPRWLDEGEQRTWRSFITASRLFWERVERQLQQCAGIPHAYYEILVRLSEAPDRTLRMSQLASSSLSSRSRLSHAVARMEESGWIRRLPFPDDRRGSLAQLTEEGMARLAAAAPGHVEEVRALLFDALTPAQIAALRDISDALGARLSDVPSWPAAPDDSACDDDAGDDQPGDDQPGDETGLTAR
jgi:DNA-binding MarR family transcriptional regulator